VISPRKISALTALAVVIVDQLSKHWALNALDNDRVIHVLGSLQFNLGFNTGMAFSQAEGIGPIIGVVGLVVVAFLLVGLRRETLPGSIAVGLVAGGAAGNIVDRLFRGEGWFQGAVVDFIDLQWWPIFNVADMAIVCGAAALVVSSLMPDKRETSTPDTSDNGNPESEAVQRAD
jgi:signal peptidase II